MFNTLHRSVVMFLRSTSARRASSVRRFGNVATLEERVLLSAAVLSEKPGLMGPQPQARTISADLLAATAFLPAGVSAEQFAATITQTRPSKTVSSSEFTNLISVGETEANNSTATANPLPLGFDAGEDVAVDITGTLTTEDGFTGVGNAEEDGSISDATESGLVGSGLVTFTGTIGDGNFGTTTGDFDWYLIDQVQIGQVITIDIDTPTGTLDPIVGLYDADFNLVASNDDANGDTDSFLRFVNFREEGLTQYFAVVLGFRDGDPFQTDVFDGPGSGPGVGSTGAYTLNLGLDASDVDFFSVQLNAGDVLGVNVSGAATLVSIFDSANTLLQGSAGDATSAHPASSPLPGGGNAAASFVAKTTGTYFIGVTKSTSDPDGNYTANARVFRPPLDSAPAGEHQILFLDFDGATLNPSIFGGPNENRTLSPLSSFLAGWGLSAGDENAVINAIIASVTETMDTDMVTKGLNGRFDIEIRNSRDHADPFGQANVSRIVIGGTIAELGIGTIGIAETIDVGNFDTTESAVVLLDLLSGNDANSLNQFAIAAGRTKIEFVGTGVGNITAHEAGHFFGGWHTNQFNPNATIMDQGGNLPGTVGVGPDLIFGNADDVDVDFGIDEFESGEGFTGFQDSLNTLAFGLTTAAMPEIEVKVGATNVADGGTFSFGTATQGGAAVSRTFVIKNIGTAALSVDPATFVSGAGFTFTTNIGAPVVLPPNTSINLVVSMSTTTAGAKSAAIQFGNGDANESPFNITLTGTVNPSGGGNVAPALTAWDGSTAYAENALPVVIDSNAAIADTDSANLSTGKLTIAITTNLEATKDRLGVKNVGTGPGQISVAGTAISFGGIQIGTFTTSATTTTNLIVTFNAASTAAAASALLKAITFHSTSENPSTLPRTVTAFVTDGDGGTSATLSKTITVTKTNDAPVITLWDGTVAYAENALPVVLDSTAVVADADSLDFSTGKLTIQVTTNVEAAFDRLGIKHVGNAANQIGVAGTTVSFGGVPIGTFAGTTTLTVTLNASATVAATSALLKAITFSSLSNNPSILPRTVTAKLTDGDGGTSATLSKTVTVTKTNDVPVLGAWDTTVAYAENAVPTVLDTNATVVDVDLVDFNTGKLTVQVTTNVETTDRVGIKNTGNAAGQIGVAGTTVSFGGVPIGTFAGTTTLTVTLNASSTGLAVQALLRAVTFSSVSENPSILPRTVKATLTDGDGGTSNIVTKAVTVTKTNDAPVITAFDTAISYTEGAVPVLLDSNAAVTDADSLDFNTGKLTVNFLANGSSFDRLAIKNTGNLAGQIGVSGTTVNYGGVPIGTFTGGTTSLVITLNAAANKAAVDKLLRALTFSNVSTTPSTLPRTVRLTLTDGDGGTSLAVTKTITVNAVPDQPAASSIPWGATKNNVDIWA